MADLSTMFNQLGPAGGSILAGVQMGNEANAAKSEQAMRQAQMDKILMDTDQAKLMNPLELQAKQQAIDSAKFKAVQEKDLHRIDTLGRALPDIKAAPDATKHAVMEQAFINAGLPLDPQTKQQLYSMDGKTLTKFLEDKYSFAITNSPAYRQAMALELERTKSHKYAADSSATTQKAIEQMRIDAGKYNKNKVATDVTAALLKPISSAQKAEILESAYYAADAAGDMKMAAQYKERAQQARARAAEDAQNRAIGAPGTMGYATQGGDIDLQNKPAPAANAPIAGGPALGTAANPIVLK
jgi:hypothetical protein